MTITFDKERERHNLLAIYAVVNQYLNKIAINVDRLPDNIVDRIDSIVDK
jgi:hypothetical protein